MKKILSVLVCIALVLAVATGCKQAAKPQSSSSSGQSDQSTSNSQPVTQPEADPTLAAMYQRYAKIYIAGNGGVMLDMVPTYIQVMLSSAVSQKVAESYPDTQFVLTAERAGQSEMIRLTVYANTREDLELVFQPALSAAIKKVESVIEGVTCTVADYGVSPVEPGAPKEAQWDYAKEATCKRAVQLYVNSPYSADAAWSAEQSAARIATYMEVLGSSTIRNMIRERCGVEKFALQVEQIENTAVMCVTIYCADGEKMESLTETVINSLGEQVFRIISNSTCRVVDLGKIENIG